MLLTLLLIIIMVVAAGCFIEAARLVPTPKVNLIALGLFFVVLYFLIPLLYSLTSRSHYHKF